MTSTAEAAEISISCGAVGMELELCQDGANAWAEATGNTVEIISTPNSATERLALYQQILAANSADIDVYQIDVIWPGILANHFIDLGEHIDEATRGTHFEAIVDNNTVDGRFVAMPWFTDAGILYYRTDLLEKFGKQPPETWEDLAATAKEIQDAERAEGSDKMWGFVFQAKAYEGLTYVRSNGSTTMAAARSSPRTDPSPSITIRPQPLWTWRRPGSATSRRRVC